MTREYTEEPEVLQFRSSLLHDDWRVCVRFVGTSGTKRIYWVEQLTYPNCTSAQHLSESAAVDDALNRYPNAWSQFTIDKSAQGPSAPKPEAEQHQLF